MRTYIFTAKELEALEQFIKTRKRNPTVNKLIHYIKHNERLFDEIQLFLELWALAHKPRRKSNTPKMMPGRPPKLVSSMSKAV